MKIVFVLIIPILILVQSCKNEKIVKEYYSDGEIKTIKHFPNKRDTLNYYVTHFRYNGTKIAEGLKSNGDKEGKWYHYNYDGNIKQIENMCSGMLCDSQFYYFDNGKLFKIKILDEPIPCFCDTPCHASFNQIVYWENGNIREISHLTECKFDGVVKLYDSLTGNLEKVITVKNDIYDGNYIEYGDEWIVVGQYKNDLEQGEWKWYDLDSNLETTGEYKDGNYDGKFIYYYRDGNIQAIKYYKNNELVYFEKAYDINGKQTLSNGYGSFNKYHKNGNLKEITTFANSKMNGLNKTYYKNGNLKFSGNYKNSKLNGICNWYYDNGQLEQTSNYINGKSEGEIIDYFKNGKLQQIRIFKNDSCIAKKVAYDIDGNQTLTAGTGTFYNYHENGQLKYVGNYQNSLRKGVSKWYFNNGQLKESALYKDDLRIEVLNSFNREGIELEAGTLKNGNGTWISYDENGQIKKVDTFENGIKISK